MVPLKRNPNKLRLRLRLYLLRKYVRLRLTPMLRIEARVLRTLVELLRSWRCFASLRSISFFDAAQDIGRGILQAISARWRAKLFTSPQPRTFLRKGRSEAPLLKTPSPSSKDVLRNHLKQAYVATLLKASRPSACPLLKLRLSNGKLRSLARSSVNGPSRNSEAVHRFAEQVSNGLVKRELEALKKGILKIEHFAIDYM